MQPLPALAPRIAAIRGFNRFYTRQIGLLQDKLHDTPYGLGEARLLYEIGHHAETTAATLCKELSLDPGYVSRLLRDFERQGLIAKTPSPEDGRQNLLRLTAAGRAALGPLEARADEAVATLLQPIDTAAQARLVAAMGTITALLDRDRGAASASPFLLRPHRPGDLGWIVGRHGALYAEDYGWNAEFEAYVAAVAAKFIRHFDAARECCWIAEIDGEMVGSVCLVKHTAKVAQLRLFLVEPKARGLGIGKRLIAECVRFARQAGYRKIILWTHSVLHAARHLYEAAGFRLVREEMHRQFGPELIGQFWELDLRADARPQEKRRRGGAKRRSP